MAMKTRYGDGITTSDIAILDDIIESSVVSIREYEDDDMDRLYGEVMDNVSDKVLSGNFSISLKHNVRIRSSWLKSYVWQYICNMM